ncbi:MAG TPA: aspartate/glutamate racemase family protein [Sedimentisphaerales bacterium]|nr:aspartate/glutamate racemase family protein [Sedimentisphaerales bacterium]
MKQIMALYAGQGLAELMMKTFAQIAPEVKVYNMIDDSLIQECIREGCVTKGVKQRLLQHIIVAEQMGLDAILSTCSSMGEVVDVARQFCRTPIVKIDEDMAAEAVSRYQRLGVLATIPTALNPTMKLLEAKAKEAGRKVEIINGMANGAYQALVAGRPDEHDRLILDAAMKVAHEADAIVLAQGSMARMMDSLNSKAGKPVLASPPFAARAVKAMLEAKK